ncbi:MAG: DUF421 domain-containing protein [Ruminiclostridium sp.]|nr:DUF421 domain-containing protein [Ruminiclostridium sp.]
MNGIWNSIEELNTLGFAARTLIVGIALFTAGRFLPHRSGGQYAGFDFTFFWMMGGLIASPLFDSKINFTNTIIAVVTIFLTHYLISYIAVKSRAFERIAYGKAEILILKGRIQRKNMLKSLFPIEMLLAQMREIDVSDVSEVDTAILETGGRVSILKKGDYAPVTPADMSIPVTEGGLPVILVNDGKIIDKNLKYLGYNQKWLKDELLKYGVSNIKSVYLAAINGAGQIYYSMM